MRSFLDVVATMGLLTAGVLLLALGFYQSRLHRRVIDVYAVGDLLLGTGIIVGSAYHLTLLISE